jgi:hypothetical protein
VTAKVERKHAVSRTRENARERQPVAEIRVLLVTEHDPDGSAAEDDAAKREPVPRPEGDRVLAFGFRQASLAERRRLRCGRRSTGEGKRSPDEREGDQGSHAH